MNYKIAVASSNKNTVDLSFGECEEFLIYEVDENDSYKLIEVRICKNDLVTEDAMAVHKTGCGCSGNGKRCSTVHTKKVENLSDCKCILCIRAGEKVKKLFSHKAITLFEIDGSIEPLLEKVIFYYARARR